MQDCAFSSDPLLSAPPKLRILQHRGRRYAVSIEPVYWEVLQQAAEEAGCRLNQLVAGIAAEAAGGNLAARLRLYAVQRLRREAAEGRASAGRTNIGTVLSA